MKYRIMYWFGSCITDCCIIAGSKDEAIGKFRRNHKNEIYKIIEVSE